MNDAHIAALQAERAEYVERKLPKRVAQVDAELARYGIEPPVKAPKNAKG